MITSAMNTPEDTLSLESGASSTNHYDDDDRIPSGSSARDETGSTSERSAGAGSATSIVGGRETRLVRRSKAFLALVLVLAATVGAVATYRFLEQEDEIAMSREVSLVFFPSTYFHLIPQLFSRR